MMREYQHRNIIFNSVCTYMGDKQAELLNGKSSVQHFIFSTESAKEISLVVDAFKRKSAYPLSGAFRRIGKRKTDI
jgi:hypothetical protein